MKRNAFIAIVTVAATLTAVAAELPPDIFRKGERILFIGDSITHGGRKGTFEGQTPMVGFGWWGYAKIMVAVA